MTTKKTTDETPATAQPIVRKNTERTPYEMADTKRLADIKAVAARFQAGDVEGFEEAPKPDPRREDYTAEDQAGVVVEPTPTRTDDSQTVPPAPAIPGEARQTH